MSIESTTTAQFQFYPGMESLPHSLEVVISKSVKLKSADGIYFRRPSFSRIGQDEVLVVPFEEWAIARLLAMLRQTNPTLDVQQVCKLDGINFRILLNVRDQTGQSVAKLALHATQYSQQWEGFAHSYSMGVSVIDELEALLAKEPHRLCSYELSVPSRPKLGWDGERFLNQQMVSKAPYDVAMPSSKKAHTFRIKEHPRYGSGNSITEKWPPFSAWHELSNWSLLHKNCCDIDETKVKPATNQNYIGRSVDYTAGEVYLPDDSVLPCVLCLDEEGRAMSVICMDSSTIWDIPCYRSPLVGSDLTSEQRKLFPLQVASRLSESKRNPKRTIRFRISEEGYVSAC